MSIYDVRWLSAYFYPSIRCLISDPLDIKSDLAEPPLPHAIWGHIWTTPRISQCTGGEFNEIVYNKKKIITAWKCNTYWVRNHLVPNPTNSKFIRWKNISKNIFLLQQKVEKVRKNKKNLLCSTENFNMTAVSQLVSWSNTSTLFNHFVKKAVTF